MVEGGNATWAILSKKWQYSICSMHQMMNGDGPYGIYQQKWGVTHQMFRDHININILKQSKGILPNEMEYSI